MSTPASVGSRLTVFDWLNRLLVVLIVLAVLGAIGLNFLPLIRQDPNLPENRERSKEEVPTQDADIEQAREEIPSLENATRHVERTPQSSG